MTRGKAIKIKCSDCAGSPKEVTLCHLCSCPLWQYRFGNSIISGPFKKRMNGAKKQFPVDFAEMLPLLQDELKDTEDLAVKGYVAQFLEKNK